jgi:pilus assembly protein CpaB
MAVATARQSRSGRLSSGRRSGIIIMAVGFVVAVLAAVLVFAVAQQSRVPETAPETVAQVYVVTATQDVESGSLVPAEAFALKPFPKAYVPQGALTTLEQLTGTYATTRLTRDQILLASQVTATRPATNLSESIPAGKVALWMPLPELLAQAGVLRAGDRVDILLTMPLPEPAVGLTTLTTLQNVELLYVGAPPAAATQGAAAAALASALAPPAAAGSARMVLFVVDPQDALVAKFIKDSGGTIDYAMRARASQDVAGTVAVDARALAGRFNVQP